MTPFAIAGLQLNLSGTADNLPHMRARLDYTMSLFPWVQMVMFSELAAFGPLTTRAQPLPGPAERAFQEMAAHHKIWLINGSLFELHEGKVYNTSSVIDPDGRVVGRYRKMFPFLPYEMDVTPGNDFLVFDVPDVGRFGLSICYDMWFAETSRTLTALGAEVILHPTMTTTIDRDVELAISRATAVTNQCFFIDINGEGDGGNGRSLVVGPAGDVLHQAGTSEELIPIEIDLDRVRRSREIGVRGLGQPLKSFRDCQANFTVYQNDPRMQEYFNSLGPLARQQRGSRAGIKPNADAALLPPMPPQAPPPAIDQPPPAGGHPSPISNSSGELV
jgi:predicted amidohydrolase